MMCCPIHTLLHSDPLRQCIPGISDIVLRENLRVLDTTVVAAVDFPRLEEDPVVFPPAEDFWVEAIFAVACCFDSASQSYFQDAHQLALDLSTKQPERPPCQACGEGSERQIPALMVPSVPMLHRRHCPVLPLANASGGQCRCLGLAGPYGHGRGFHSDGMDDSLCHPCRG